jgi:hypothetical protein
MGEGPAGGMGNCTNSTERDVERALMFKKQVALRVRETDLVRPVTLHRNPRSDTPY